LHYYSLAGYLIGSFDGNHTTFYLTDALGSVLLSFSQSTILGEQVYGPYGNSRYLAGSINTPKGYTGQIHDEVTGLDYYNARYYDPVVGMFMSVDLIQGNQVGMDPYAYVSANPETNVDPTGQRSAGCVPGRSGCSPTGTPTGSGNGGSGSGGSAPKPWRGPRDDDGNPIYSGRSNYRTHLEPLSSLFSCGVADAARALAEWIYDYRRFGHSRPDTSFHNFAAGEWYITSAFGRDLTKEHMMTQFPVRSDKTANQGSSEGHAEQQLLDSWNPDGAIAELNRFLQQGKLAILQIVVFTQLPPCPDCQKYFQNYIDKLVNAANRLITVETPPFFPEIVFSVTASSYVPSGNYKQALWPGTALSQG